MEQELDTYVRVRKDILEYNDQINKINIQTIKDLLKQKQELRKWLKKQKRTHWGVIIDDVLERLGVE